MSSAIGMTEEKSIRIQELLKEIWTAFLQAGTSNNREIVESLATILTKKKETHLPENVRPHWPRNRYNPENIIELIQQAVELAGDAGQLFDRYILFYNADKAKKDAAYPMPRHLIDSMLKLLQIESSHAFADFTCGTGGFLVNRNNSAPSKSSVLLGETLGIDRVHEVLRLAGANVILHEMNATHLYTGDALDLCSPNSYATSLWPDTLLAASVDKERLTTKLFDRIAMAAPFGVTIDNSVATYWSNESGHASENIFTRLALAKLAEKGRAVLLIPSSLTWKGTENVPALRELLLKQHTIQAVISLHEHALRPFSNNVASSILLLSKEPAPQQHQIWLCKVERDGYTQGADRNLLMPPQQTPEENDLPLIETALLLKPEAFALTWASATPLTTSALGLSIASIISGEQFHGCVLQTDEYTLLQSLTLFTIETTYVSSQQFLYVLVKAKHSKQDPIFYLFLLSLTGVRDTTDKQAAKVTFSSEAEAKAWLKTTYRLERVPDGRQIYDNGFAGQKILLAFDGRILGLTLPIQGIEENDIHPEKYIRAREKAFSTRQPAETLEKIRQDQQLISQILTNLSGQLEVKPVVAANLPPLLHERADSKIVAALGVQQKSLWRQIRIQYTHEQKRYALYFTAKDILHDLMLANFDSAKIQETLDLLVCMGLLVRVLITDKKTKKTLPYYRMPLQLDATDLSRERELS